jgi:uncharacterized repeat protein (TIGR01451 family)
MSTRVSAQTVFIPDTYLRTWLNNSMPGVVDANGYCDTLAWNTAPPFSLSCVIGNVPEGTTVDLEGIQYLKVDWLNLWDGTGSDNPILWPGYPRANTKVWVNGLHVDSIQGAFFPLPPALDNFFCICCGLTTIPAFSGSYLSFKNVELSGTLTLPTSLWSLSFENAGITSLPTLPADLNSLSITDDSLTAWPTALPVNLQTFSAKRCGLPDPPALPTELWVFVYNENGMTALQSLPNYLGLVSVNGNALTSLPALPSTLLSLNVEGNPLSTLPVLPATIDNIHADNCPLLSLPELPDGLSDLENRYNPLLTCLPVLPSTLQNLKLYGTGVTCLPNIPPNMYLLGGEANLGIAATLCNPATTLCPILDPLITGVVFNDANGDGVKDVGESVRPFATVGAQPGNFLAGSGYDGGYALPVDTGSFTVAGQPTLYEGTTTAPYAVTFTSIGEVDSLNDIGYAVVPGIYDLVTTLEAAPTRPGFETLLWVTVENAGTEITDAVVELVFDGTLDYVSSNYTPSSINGNSITWNAGALYPGWSWTAQVRLYTPTGVAIGTPLVHMATAVLGQADMTPPDNTVALNDTVVGSYDPNDKRVVPQTMTPWQVSTGAPLTWTVRFQNTGTFPAERVLITDTLSTDLRWSTMDVISASHAHTWYLLNGVLHVLFEGINLPDSSSDEAGSHGFIKFGMKPQGTLADGVQVENVANIYFDFNESVITAPAIFTVDASTAVTSSAIGTREWNMWPNPASDQISVSGLSSATNTMVEVLDIHGTVVRMQESHQSITRIDLHDLTSGVYALRISSGGTITSHTFFKR